MSRIAFAAVLLGVLPALADGPPAPGAGAPAVTVPTFPNGTCPIMAKRVSLKLFVDTPKGRIYMCCVPCAKEIRKDPDRAHAAAYPRIEKAANAACPITGKAIPEKDAPTVVLQGHEIALCCRDCVDEARKDSQPTLAKAMNPKVRDVGNRTCPITGKAVGPNAFALVGDDLVRLSSADCVEAVRKDPAGALRKAEGMGRGEGEGRERGERRGRDDHGDRGHGR